MSFFPQYISPNMNPRGMVFLPQWSPYEEMQHDISKLQHQMQQILLLQKVRKNELEAMMNVKIDGIKRDMIVLNDNLKLENFSFMREPPCGKIQHEDAHLRVQLEIN